MDYNEKSCINKPVIEVSAVSKSFTSPSDNSKMKALDNVSFSVAEGEFIVITGANGSGKTLLMSIISGLETADSGFVKINRGEVGLVFQDADSQILGETPEEDISFGLKNCRFSPSEIKQRTEQALKECGLWEKKDFPARLMSGGEKRRLAVAAMLALGRSSIIFDEPFANLDWQGIKQVCSILKELKSGGHSIIVLTHEIEKILALADRFIILDRGKLKFDGSPEEGLKINLADYGIKNPLACYNNIHDLIWD